MVRLYNNARVIFFQALTFLNPCFHKYKFRFTICGFNIRTFAAFDVFKTVEKIYFLVLYDDQSSSSEFHRLTYTVLL